MVIGLFQSEKRWCSPAGPQRLGGGLVSMGQNEIQFGACFLTGSYYFSLQGEGVDNLFCISSSLTSNRHHLPSMGPANGGLEMCLAA